jgi:O-antigen/teichoic acid export membrane protein
MTANPSLDTVGPVAGPDNRAGKSLLRNVGWIALTQQVARVLNYVQVVLVIRFLGQTEYGVYSVTQAFPSMFFVLTDLGVNSVLILRIAKNPNSDAACFRQILFMKVLLVLGFVAFMAGAIHLSNYERAIKSLLLISVGGFVASSFSEVATAYCRAHGNFMLEGILAISRSLMFLLLTVVTITMNAGLLGIVAAFVVTNVVVSGGALLWLNRQVRVRCERLTGRSIVVMLKEASPFAMQNFIAPVYGQMDILMLSMLGSYEAVGIYNAGARIAVFLQLVPQAIGRVLFPVLARQFQTSRLEFLSQATKVVKWIVLMGLAVAIGLPFCSDRVVALFFGSQFRETAAILEFQAVTVGFYFLRHVCTSILYAAERAKTAVLLIGIGAVLNAGLDLCLIPHYGARGAAAAALIAEITTCVGYFLAARRLGKIGVEGKGLGIALSAGLLAVAAWAGRDYSLMVQIGSAGLIYALSLLLLKVVRVDELPFLSRFHAKVP